MQPLLNASKAWQTVSADSLKARTIKKTSKNKSNLVTGEPKTSSVLKPRRWNNFMVKFQILNMNCYDQNQP